MYVNTVENIELVQKEKDILKKATEIIKGILNEITDITWMFDNQNFPKEVEEILEVTLSLEDKRIFSAFNVLNDKDRTILRDLIPRHL